MKLNLQKDKQKCQINMINIDKYIANYLIEWNNQNYIYQFNIECSVYI